MKYIALSEFKIPGLPKFYKGESYRVKEEIAQQLIRRNLLEVEKEVKTQKMVEELPEEKMSKSKRKRVTSMTAK